MTAPDPNAPYPDALAAFAPSPFTADADIVRIGRAMFDRTLPKPEWTHAAHIAAAVWVVADRPDLTAWQDLPPAIRAYNEATGVANTDTAGYHETITQASILAVAGFVGQAPGLGLAAIGNRLLASPLGRPDWLLAYWSAAALFSVRARRFWLDPDLAAFPYGRPADKTAVRPEGAAGQR